MAAFAFKWSRDSAGYRIAERRAQKNVASAFLAGEQSAVSSALVIERLGGQQQEYAPLSAPELLTNFADIQSSPESVLEFISTYGFLGLSGRTAEAIEAEPVDEILKCRDEIKTLFEVAAAGKNLVGQFEKTVDYREWRLRATGAPTDIKHPAPLAEIRAYVAMLFNDSAEKYANQFRPMVVLAGAYDDHSPLAVRIVPKTLVASLWVQLANVLTGDSSFRICENPRCRKVFQAANRSDQEVCSPKCRVARHRLLHKQSAPAKRRESKK